MPKFGDQIANPSDVAVLCVSDFEIGRPLQLTVRNAFRARMAGELLPNLLQRTAGPVRFLTRCNRLQQVYRGLPTCSFLQHTSLYGVRNRLQVAV